jgi:hypothetical protein
VTKSKLQPGDHILIRDRGKLTWNVITRHDDANSSPSWAFYRPRLPNGAAAYNSDVKVANEFFDSWPGRIVQVWRNCICIYKQESEE